MLIHRHSVLCQRYFITVTCYVTLIHLWKYNSLQLLDEYFVVCGEFLPNTVDGAFACLHFITAASLYANKDY